MPKDKSRRIVIGETFDGRPIASVLMPDGGRAVVVDRQLYAYALTAANKAMTKAVDAVKAGVRERKDKNAA